MSQATILELDTRRSQDFFYGVFFNDTVRNNVFTTVLEIVEKKLRQETLSNRLSMTLDRLRQKQMSNLIKHAFIFFALDQESDVQDFVLCSIRSGKRREEVKTFLKKDVRDITERFLNGRLTGLVHYVDEVRKEVTINIGFD